MFIIVNWFMMTVLIAMYLLIHNIKDQLNIKNELFWIIIVWNISNVIYFLLATLKRTSTVLDDFSAANWTIFLMIISRDFFIVLIQTLYCWKISN